MFRKELLNDSSIAVHCEGAISLDGIPVKQITHYVKYGETTIKEVS